jgi:hypothetical protein
MIDNTEDKPVEVHPNQLTLFDLEQVPQEKSEAVLRRNNIIIKSQGE